VKAQLKKGLEVLGVVAPIVCLIHCLATPILLTALPFVTAAGGDHDVWFHWAIVGLCAVAIVPAYLAHKKAVVLALFVAGAAFVIVPAYVPILETMTATVATAVCASICLVSANLLNRKYSKELSGEVGVACCSQSHHSEV
jgi:hypothetical protein